MLRVYLFWYKDLTEPVKIEAVSKQQAREKLIDLLPFLPEVYRYTEIINETIETLISGTSERYVGKQRFLFYHGRGWVAVNDNMLK